MMIQNFLLLLQQIADVESQFSQIQEVIHKNENNLELEDFYKNILNKTTREI